MNAVLLSFRRRKTTVQYRNQLNHTYSCCYATTFDIDELITFDRGRSLACFLTPVTFILYTQK